MQASTFNAATKLAVSNAACELRRVQGYFKHTADLWLQIHDSDHEPISGNAASVPVKTYALPYNAPYSWSFDPGTLTLARGCYVAVSSTEGYYTTVAYSAGVTYCDIEADFYKVYTQNLSVAQAGDFTTGRDSLTVWANGGVASGKQLRLIDVQNNEVGDLYLMVFRTTAIAGATGFLYVQKVLAGVWTNLTFGERGLLTFGKSSAGVIQDGCYIYLSASASALDTTGLTTVSYIRAISTTQA